MPAHIRVIFLIGKPNAGKSTYAKALAKEHGETLVVSPGNWLRELKSGGTDLGQFVFRNWSHDALTPLVTQYLDQTMERVCERARDAASANKTLTVIVDGFPRNVSEASAIAAIVRGHPHRVIELCVDEDELMRRAAERARDADDTDQAMSIRLSSYSSNIDAIRRELDFCNVDHVQLINNNSSADIWSSVETTSRRLAIPPTAARRTLARKNFIEAQPIERATVVQMSMRLAQSTMPRQRFFGTHPMSLTREDFVQIRRFPYLVALKATGVRYMCLIANKCMWLISRTLAVYGGLRNEALGQFEGTLVDGELIGEEDASMYLVLDCLAAGGQTCTGKPIVERIRRAQPLVHALSRGPLFFHSQEYVDRTRIVDLLKRGDALPWEVDGIIFQPQKLPYRLGIDYYLYKWKPLGHNTVDFYYNAEDAGLYCRIAPVSTGPCAARAHICPIDVSANAVIERHKIAMVRFGRLLPFFIDACSRWLRDGMIIECVALPEAAIDDMGIDVNTGDGVWQENECVWAPQMHRADKTFANFDWVAQGVIQSIVDNVTQEELVEQCLAANISASDIPPTVAAHAPHLTKRSRRA